MHLFGDGYVQVLENHELSWIPNAPSHLEIYLVVLNELSMHVACHWNGISDRSALLHRLREWLLWSGLQFLACGSYFYKIIKLISMHHQNCSWEEFSFLNRQLSFAFLSCFHLALCFAIMFILHLSNSSYFFPFTYSYWFSTFYCLTVVFTPTTRLMLCI